MQNWRLLLTRTAPDCQLQADALKRLGIQAKTLPLIEIVPLPETAKQRSQLLDFDRYTALIVTSKPAARLILERLDYYWPQLPIQQTWFTVGKATAQILQSAGLNTYCPSYNDNSEALWQLPTFQQHLATPNCRILIIKGQGGRTWLMQQLQLKGITTETTELYRRQAVSYNEATLLHAITHSHINAIVINSQQALQTLYTTTKKHWQQLTQLTFFVPSERLVEQAKQLAIKQIINCQNPSLEALITALNCH